MNAIIIHYTFMDKFKLKLDPLRDNRIEPLRDTNSSSVEQRLEQLGYK
jgi:hypothetical protein